MAKAKYFTSGVSFPDEALYVAAKARAASLGLSFSQYVAKLIREDLASDSAGKGEMLLRRIDPAPYDDAAIMRESPEVVAAAQNLAAVAMQAALRRQGGKYPPATKAPPSSRRTRAPGGAVGVHPATRPEDPAQHPTPGRKGS